MKTIFCAMILLVASAAEADTMYVWNCGKDGGSICATNIEKRVPRVFGVAKVTSEELEATANWTPVEGPQKNPYRWVNWYMPDTFRKDETYPVRLVRERRQIGDIDRPVYVIYGADGEEIAVSEIGRGPLWVGVDLLGRP